MGIRKKRAHKRRKIRISQSQRVRGKDWRKLTKETCMDQFFLKLRQRYGTMTIATSNSMTMEAAAPRLYLVALNVMSKTKMPGTSVAKPGPTPVMAKIRSKIFRETCPRIIAVLTVTGRSKGRTTFV